MTRKRGNMQVKIKRIDKSLPLPQYHTEGAVAFDLYAREDTIIAPGEILRIPTNFIIETPVGYVLQLSLRSGAPKKKPGLVVPHGVGLIDQDFCGPEDEVLMQVLNTSNQILGIIRGERFGQAMFVKIDRAEFVEVEAMPKTTRGGFGSTDKAAELSLKES